MPLRFSDCSNPWVQMILFPEGGGYVSSCCHFAPPIEAFQQNLSGRHGIGDIWNAKKLMALRKSIAENNPVFKPCKNCLTCATENSFGINPKDLLDKNIFSGLSASQLENAHALENHFNNRDSLLNSFPVGYLLRFGYKCNLRCIMCDHEKLYTQITKELDFNWLRRQEDALAKAVIVTITGGEPFFMNSSREFISWFLRNEALSDVQLHICTNGILMAPFIPLFEQRHVALEVSLDSYGDLYEKIRRGASWKTVSDNLDAFLKGQAGPRQNHELTKIHCTITRTGLPGLPDLVRWSMDRGLGMHFALVQSYNEAARHENLKETPVYLLGIPRWESYFDEAISILEKSPVGRVSVEQLTLMRDTLNRAATGYARDIDNIQLHNLEYEIETLRRQQDALLNSRWRLLGRRLGLVKRQAFE